MPRSFRRPAALFALAVVACLALAGCGGVNTVNVSGKVTFQGKPVPAGKIYFIPKEGGATGYADIKDGSYNTASKGGSGVSPGAVTVRIEGYDPSGTPDKPKDGGEAPTGKLLFMGYETTADLTAAGTKDFDVPATAAKGPVAPAGKPGTIIP